MKRRFAQHPLSPSGLGNGKALPSDLTSAPIIQPAGRTQLHTPHTPNFIKLLFRLFIRKFSYGITFITTVQKSQSCFFTTLSPSPQIRGNGIRFSSAGHLRKPWHSLTQNQQPSLPLTCPSHPWNWRDADGFCVPSLDFSFIEARVNWARLSQVLFVCLFVLRFELLIEPPDPSSFIVIIAVVEGTPSILSLSCHV